MWVILSGQGPSALVEIPHLCIEDLLRFFDLLFVRRLLVTFDAVLVAQTRRQVAHLVALCAELPPPLLAFLPGGAITEVVGRWVVVEVRFCVGQLGRTGERPAQIPGFVPDLLEGVPGDVLGPAGRVIAVVKK